MLVTILLSLAGCAGRQDFGYNRRQQTRQSAMILIGSVITALVFTLIK